MRPAVRLRIRRELPADTFAPRPWRALLIPLWATIAVGAGAVVLLAGLPWWADLLLAALIGQCFGSLGFVAHEVLHGATVRSRRLQDLLGFIGFLPYVVSPHLWREWHNRRHHTHANQGVRDPDAFGSVEQYKPGGKRRGFHFLLPGSGHPLSAFFHLYWFTTHNLVNLFGLSKRFKGYDRRPALVQTALGASIWLTILVTGGVIAGWEVLLVTLVPMFIGNGLVMGYISTNHMMRPELDHDDPVDHSMSLNVPWIVDLMHGWFSHHVEHHLFPGMSPSQAPKVRAWLLEKAPHRYVSPPWYKAIWWLYRTPRPHSGPTVLAHPDHPEHTVDLDKLGMELRDGRFERLAPKPHGRPDAA